MKTANEMIFELQKIFDALKDGSINHRTASEMNNTAGKMVATANAQILYAKARGEEPNIPFLDSPTK